MINMNGFNSPNFGRLIIEQDKETFMKNTPLQTMKEYKKIGPELQNNIISDVIVDKSGDVIVTDNLHEKKFHAPSSVTVNGDKLILGYYYREPLMGYEEKTFNTGNEDKADQIAYRMKTSDKLTKAVEFSNLIETENLKTQEGKEYKEKVLCTKELLDKYGA